VNAISRKKISFRRTDLCLCECMCVASVHAQVMSKWWLHKKLNLRRRRRCDPFISPGERVLSPPPLSLPPTGRLSRGDNNDGDSSVNIAGKTNGFRRLPGNRLRCTIIGGFDRSRFSSVFHVFIYYLRYVSFHIVYLPTATIAL